MFHGYAITTKSRIQGFNSGDAHHNLDGHKLEKFKVDAFCASQREVQELIDYLEITKLSMV